MVTVSLLPMHTIHGTRVKENIRWEDLLHGYIKARPLCSNFSPGRLVVIINMPCLYVFWQTFSHFLVQSLLFSDVYNCLFAQVVCTYSYFFFYIQFTHFPELFCRQLWIIHLHAFNIGLKFSSGAHLQWHFFKLSSVKKSFHVFLEAKVGHQDNIIYI